MDIKRGEIYYACLDPVFGQELGGFKHRPVLVISINDINKKTRLATVIPGTDAEHNQNTYPNVITVEPDGNNGLKKTTNFQCHQIRAIEQGRFTGKAKGRISQDTFTKIEKAIGICLGLS